MAVDPISHFRIPGDEELYERPVAANFGDNQYEAVFDPFGLTNFGQRYIYLTLNDMAAAINVAVVFPTNPATGNISYDFVPTNYFDGNTGNYLLTFSKQQSVEAAVVIQNALSAGVIDSEPNNLSTLSDLGLNVILHYTDKDGRVFGNSDQEGLLDGQVVSNLGQSELDFSKYIETNSNYSWDFGFIPTLSVDPLTGEFIPIEINLIGSSGSDLFGDAPGATNFDSAINNFDATDPYDSLSYISSPTGIVLDFPSRTIVDGWGFTDTFTPDKFNAFIMSTKDDLINLSGASLESNENYITIADLGGDDFYFGQAVLDTTVAIADTAGTDFFDLTELFGNLIIGNDAHETWDYGYRAMNVDNNVQIGTQNTVNLSGYSKFSDVIYGQKLSLDSSTDFETILNNWANSPMSYTDTSFISLSLNNYRAFEEYQKPVAFFLDDAFSNFHQSVDLSTDNLGRENAARISDIQAIAGSIKGDIIDLTSSTYTLDGQNFVVGGDDGDDIIWGSAADEIINGGAGNDTINGGAGSDVLIGDTGYDIFEFTQSAETNIIRDFSTDDALEFYVRPEDTHDWQFAENIISWGAVTIELHGFTGTQATIEDTLTFVDIPIM
mgnify:CR=1 FL=1